VTDEGPVRRAVGETPAPGGQNGSAGAPSAARPRTGASPVEFVPLPPLGPPVSAAPGPEAGPGVGGEGASTPPVQWVDPRVPDFGAAGAGDVAPVVWAGPSDRPRRRLSRQVLGLAVASSGLLLVGVVAALVLDLVADSVDDGGTAGTLRLLGWLVVVPAVAGSAALLATLARRLHIGLDEPVDQMRRASAQIARGDLDARTAVSGSTDVTALGEELDAAAEALQRHVRRLRLHAEWGAQSRMIFEALDLVDEEAEAHAVAQQALGIIDGERSVELLLAPHGSTELTAVAANPNVAAPGCPVDETSGCVAIRRAQVVVFDSSESINACPKLRNRPYGACSAACVPVSVSGRPVGVLHTVAADRNPPDERMVGQLATLSTQLGNRLGALRALESSRHEAATDKLTGLPNRRLLESQIASLIERSTPFVLVLADLDKFKNLNDTYGHEVGDRALQLYAQVLRDKVRGNDVIARLGGEEFVLVYPNMSVTTSIEAIERIRDGLTAALAVSQVPDFTCSFGITHSAVGRSGDAILRVADAGLLRAKELGGDQVVYADESLAARIFGDDDGGAGRAGRGR
jgi:diguanylate cyclase (GGDEF)-like protein